MRDNKSIALDRDDRTRAIASLRRFVVEEMDEELGGLKAEVLLDFVLAEFGPTVYNQAIADAKRFFDERAGDLGAVCHREEFRYWPTRGK